MNIPAGGIAERSGCIVVDIPIQINIPSVADKSDGCIFNASVNEDAVAEIRYCNSFVCNSGLGKSVTKEKKCTTTKNNYSYHLIVSLYTLKHNKADDFHAVVN